MHVGRCGSILCSCVITLFQKSPVLSHHLPVSKSTGMWHCVAVLLALWRSVERHGLLDPTCSPEQWSENDCKQVFHIWLFVLCWSCISSWARSL